MGKLSIRLLGCCAGVLFGAIAFPAEPAAPAKGDQPAAVTDVDDAAPLTLDSLRVAFLYSAVSKTAVPWDEYLKVNEGVRNARDEFERRDKVQEARPDLEMAQKSLLGVKTFRIPIDGELGQYDFDRKGFPTNFGDTMFIPYSLWVGGPGFAVSLRNGGKYSFLKMEEDQARKLAAAMRDCCTYRHATFIIDVQPVSAEKTPMNGGVRRNVIARIVHMKIVRENQVLGEL